MSDDETKFQECTTIQQLILLNTPLRHEFLKIDKMVCAIHIQITNNEDEIREYQSGSASDEFYDEFYELCDNIIDIICCGCNDETDTKIEISDRVQEFLSSYEL